MKIPWPSPDSLDPFEIYRWMLAILGASYTIVVTAHSVTQFASRISQIGPRGSLVRRYLVVQALRMKFRRFAGDLLHVAILIIVLVYLIGLHRSWRVFEL